MLALAALAIVLNGLTVHQVTKVSAIDERSWIDYLVRGSKFEIAQPGDTLTPETLNELCERGADFTVFPPCTPGKPLNPKKFSYKGVNISGHSPFYFLVTGPVARAAAGHADQPPTRRQPRDVGSRARHGVAAARRLLHAPDRRAVRGRRQGAVPRARPDHLVTRAAPRRHDRQPRRVRLPGGRRRAVGRGRLGEAKMPALARRARGARRRGVRPDQRHRGGRRARVPRRARDLDVVMEAEGPGPRRGPQRPAFAGARHDRRGDDGRRRARGQPRLGPALRLAAGARAQPARRDRPVRQPDREVVLAEGRRSPGQEPAGPRHAVRDVPADHRHRAAGRTHRRGVPACSRRSRSC